MSTITSVEPQKKHTGRFNIFIDGQFAFGADEDLVVNRRLVIGKVIAPEDMKEILFEAEMGKLMERMYRWFGIRQRSEEEVRDYFKIKNQRSKIKNEDSISDLVIDATIAILKRKGLLNDLEFAKAWVEARRNSRQKGIRAIRAELFQKGIDKKIIEEAVSRQSSAISEEELAKEALEKKRGAWKNLEPQKFKRKAYEFLMRKGFEYDVVRETIENLIRKE